MTFSVLPLEAMARVAEPLRSRTTLMFLLAAIALALGTWSGGEAALFLGVVAATLTLMAIAIVGLAAWSTSERRRQVETLRTLCAHDPSPAFMTDTAGQIAYRNAAAELRLGRDDVSHRDSLAGLFADPVVTLRRLQVRAARTGAAGEDVATRLGHARLSVHRAGGGMFVWRLLELEDRATRQQGVNRLSLPMLFASPTGSILFQNDAMHTFLGTRPRTLDRVVSEAPLRSGEVMSVLTATGPQDRLVFEIAGPDRREICFLPCEGTGDEPHDRGSFDDVPVALLWLSATGEILSANRAARDMLRVDGVAMLGDLVHGLGRPVSDWLADAMAGRSLNRPEILRASRRDEEFYVQTVLRRVVTHGRPGLMAVLNDATEHRNLQSQFFQSQKMQAIGQFAGGIAHDFNNLLTAISGHCDLLRLRHSRGDPEFADLEQIRQNSDRAAGLVAQLLAFSRKQNMQAEVLDLRETLSDLTHLLNRLVGERVRLIFSHDESLRTVRADRRQIEQVMMNLVVNARDAMSRGGIINISTEERHLTEPLHRDSAVVSPGDYAVVMVRDTGTGIPAEQLKQIFEPFFTTKRVGEGTGLGLSTVYGIVKQSGGFVFVDSVVDEGTTFSVYLPIHLRLTEPAPVAQAPAPPLPSVREKDAVVLLVEDEAPVRAFASRALRLRGYTVLEADSAEAALAILEDETLHVDVFVTDVIMPGMDGPTWVRHAREKRPNARVVFVSGYTEESFSDAQTRIANSVFLPKPFSLIQLTTTVQEQLA